MADNRGSPVVQIFADSETSLGRMSRTAKTAECRIATAMLIAADTDHDARAIPGAALLIELGDEGAGETVIGLLDWAASEVERGRRRCLVSAPAGLIDLVAARVGHAGITHLCEASEEERLVAVGEAWQQSTSRVHDRTRERIMPILQPSFDHAAASAEPGEGAADAAFIRTMIRARRLRTHYFRADLFADPAWDMLLDLMATRLEGKRVAVSSLCIAAAVPATTALRWIGVLAENGLVVRVADPEDGRRIYIELADATARALGAWLRDARRMGISAV